MIVPKNPNNIKHIANCNCTENKSIDDDEIADRPEFNASDIFIIFVSMKKKKKMESDMDWMGFVYILMLRYGK